MTKRLAVMICTKNRVTELFGLLQSLRTSTFQDWDCFILDDYGDNPNTNFHFYNCIVNLLKQENHKVFTKRTDFPHGVTRARQAIVDWVLSIENYELLCRLDDDILVETDYLERLVNLIDEGEYQLVSGVTVPAVCPSFIRNKTPEIANRVILDNEGNYIMNGDDCGMLYANPKIVPAHHFRSCCMYKSEIHQKANYLPTRLSMNGFREEQIFSFRVLLAGYKIGVDFSAVNYHLISPSGGERPTMNMAPFNQQILYDFTKENQVELNKLFTHENMPSNLELSKETNLK